MVIRDCALNLPSVCHKFGMVFTDTQKCTMSTMKTLRLQFRFLIPLVVTLVAAAYLALPVMDRLTLRWFARDLNLRGNLLTNAMSDSVADALEKGSLSRLQTVLNRSVQDERLVAIGLCSNNGEILRRTAGFPATLQCEQAAEIARQTEPVLQLPGGAVQVGLHAVNNESGRIADVVVLHDVSFIERRSQDTRKHLILLIAGLGIVIAFITMVVAQLSWRGWVAGARALLRGEGLISPMGTPTPELDSFAAELRLRLRTMDDEYHRSQGPQSEWNPARLRLLLKTQLRGDQLIVVSNREPYIHEKVDDQIVVKRPASGLVTAVEPVMRACSGTWIAHGSGNADKAVVDRNNQVSVPPGSNDYALRRIWLTQEEEQGYYFGFANEGLWPLCHVAHVRPVFRESDWQHYRTINQRFADAVVEEARTEDPVILVQDYHFALLPAMVREKLPRATIITFWHIPWPNPESFGICPWRSEILQGLLGSTILGFHTQYHCKNFIETVDRTLEARIEHEHSTIMFRGDETLVESYPISIAWPEPEEVATWPTAASCRQEILVQYRLPQDGCLAVGVDRFDYTKGIIERLNAVERFLEKYPQWIGRFMLIQVAAPSRSALDEYRFFQERVQLLTQRINSRFGSDSYKPVQLLAKHHESPALMRLYRAADVCLVTSLHDGMNLVCKEFIATRDDEQGVLILSRFAGAARELNEALIVNPYHVEETADAIARAVAMPSAERRERMASLRMTVREFNVYRWAARMLSDAGRWRLRKRIEARVQSYQSPLE